MKSDLRWIASSLLVLVACRSEGAKPESSPAAEVAEPAAAAAPAAEPKIVPRRRMPVFADARRLHDDVAWLADDAQEGRRAGTDAAKRSGDWIAARCLELGLEPAGERGSFLQEFGVPLPTEVGPDSSVVWGGGGEKRTAESDRARPLFCSSSGTARGQLDWRGYGIIDADKGWNDYATRCDGKVVLVLRGTPPLPKAEAQPAAAAENPHGGNVEAGDGWGNAGSLFLKVMNAKKNGAVAVLIAPSPSEPDAQLPEFDHSRSAAPTIPALFVSASVADALVPQWRSIDEGDEAEAADASDEPARKGRARNPENAQKYAAKMESMLSGRQFDVVVKADVRRERGLAQNVLARLPGERHDRAIVVGAHYDHLGRGGEGSLAPGAQGEIHNGADDNASGTAAVLEMARLLKAGSPPECDVVFALWSGEELGLLGSAHWIEHPTFPLEQVAANLNLDMVGRAGDGQLSVLGAGSCAPFEAWLREAAAIAGLELAISASGQGIGGSDHQTFLKQEIPALHFFSGVHPDYHKPSDDIERFEDAGAAKVAVLGVELIHRMAAGGALAWIEPPAPTNDQPKLGAPFRVWFGSVPDYDFEGQGGKGLRLTGTSAGSPAEKAGLLAGDVVVQVGDVAVDNIQDFMYALQIYKPGDVVLTRFVRDGKEESVRITLSTRDAQ